MWKKKTLNILKDEWITLSLRYNERLPDIGKISAAIWKWLGNKPTLKKLYIAKKIISKVQNMTTGREYLHHLSQKKDYNLERTYIPKTL
jgi:hypothetical protein